MKQTATEFLLENIEILIKQGHPFNPIFKYYFIEEAKEMEKQQQGYSEEEAMEFFIEGYKQRAEKSDLIFDNASRMYAIHLFEQFKTNNI